jgi:hypothetical protein
MGVPPAKLHEKPAKANKWGTRSEHAAGFFDPVARRQRKLLYRGGGRFALVTPAVYAAGSLDAR